MNAPRRLHPNVMAGYLNRTNWRSNGTIINQVIQFTQGHHSVALPISLSVEDYDALMDSLLHTLERVEKRARKEILVDLV